jgi:GTP cyclohydrolase II
MPADDAHPLPAPETLAPETLAPAGGMAALVAVDRAVADLRRGAIVLVEAAPGARIGDAVLVLSAETADDGSLSRLRALAAGPARLVLTRQRASALGHASPGEGVSELLLPATVPAASLLRIADPSADRAEVVPALAPALPGVSPLAAASIELAKHARLLPAVILGPLGAAARRDIADWAVAQGLLRVSGPEILGHETHAARSLRPVAEARVPLAAAESARIVAFRPGDGGIEHLAIVIGEPAPMEPVLTRLHSECFTGDLLGSLRCDCGEQLQGAMAEIARQGSGVLLYLAQEGRGIGLVNKLRAYRLQDRGADTLEANRQLGFGADERVYESAAEMLRQLGFLSVRLMTNNPAKVAALQACGIAVAERVPLIVPANRHNGRYLETKASRLGHLF